MVQGSTSGLCSRAVDAQSEAEMGCASTLWLVLTSSLHDFWSDASLEKVRELDAFGGRLPMSIPVMPITLDFTGELYRDDNNAVRISGHLRGRAEPLAALCIHNKAYLGWVEDLVERHSHPKSKDFLRGGDRCSGASEGATDAFVVKGARRDNAEMVD